MRTTIQSVCIIGAGSSGLAIAKYLVAEKAFSRIVIFEQRSRVGGLWNYVPCPEDASTQMPVPQTDPYVGHETPVPRNCNHQMICNGSEPEDSIMSPLYDELETNVPWQMMGFSDRDWPAGCQLFPHHTEVLKYIEGYAADVLDLVKFRTQVLDVRLTEGERWAVKTRSLVDGVTGDQTNEFDAVVAASGQYSVPFVPPVQGIEEWHHRYPGSITHSMFYRTPESFTEKKVIVVGNSASGADIARQISRACVVPLLISQRSESMHLVASSDYQQKPPITEFITDGRTVVFADGTRESGIESIVYCTGYLYSFPYLTSLDPSVISTGERVENTYQHIFYAPQPTLVFPALNHKILPFPVAEAQGAAIARVFSGRLELPAYEEMVSWEQRTIDETGGGSKFHVLNYPKDANYVNMLHDWAMSASEEQEHEASKPIDILLQTSENQSKIKGKKRVGKTPPYWGEEQYWIRERIPAIKKAFQNCGSHRHEIRTMQEVGFEFVASRQDK